MSGLFSVCPCLSQLLLITLNSVSFQDVTSELSAVSCWALGFTVCSEFTAHLQTFKKIFSFLNLLHKHGAQTSVSDVHRYKKSSCGSHYSLFEKRRESMCQIPPPGGARESFCLACGCGADLAPS